MRLLNRSDFPIRSFFKLIWKFKMIDVDIVCGFMIDCYLEFIFDEMIDRFLSFCFSD